ncbi:recombinase RecT, partial [Staphylococcus epidermidis]
LLMSANPQTVLNAAATAATLDLPLDQNLGFSYIVPFKGQAQFQLGWKGFVQLAQRSGQFHRINVIEVYENQFKSFNKLTEE